MKVGRAQRASMVMLPFYFKRIHCNDNIYLLITINLLTQTQMKCVKFPESRLGTYLNILWIFSGLSQSFPPKEAGCLGDVSVLVGKWSSHYQGTGMQWTHQLWGVARAGNTRGGKERSVVANLLIFFLLSSNPKGKDGHPSLTWWCQGSNFQVRKERSK